MRDGGNVGGLFSALRKSAKKQRDTLPRINRVGVGVSPSIANIRGLSQKVVCNPRQLSPTLGLLIKTQLSPSIAGVLVEPSPSFGWMIGPVGFAKLANDRALSIHASKQRHRLARTDAAARQGSQPEGRRRALEILNGAASCFSTRARPPEAATPTCDQYGYSHSACRRLTGYNLHSARRSKAMADGRASPPICSPSSLGQERFTWGRGSIVAASETRQAYVGALKAADAGDMAPLLAFART